MLSLFLRRFFFSKLGPKNFFFCGAINPPSTKEFFFRIFQPFLDIVLPKTPKKRIRKTKKKFQPEVPFLGMDEKRPVGTYMGTGHQLSYYYEF